MSVLTFNNVSRTYGAGPVAVHALAEVSLEIAAGQTVALVGSSGSGKTTLLNLAAGLDRPSEGTVSLAGQDLARASERALALLRRKTVGFVFQSLNLVGTLTAAENVEMSLALSGQGGDERRVRARELLASADLGDKAEAFPDELSAGQLCPALESAVREPACAIFDFVPFKVPPRIRLDVRGLVGP